MNAVNITELRQHLPAYLKQVQAGQELAVTLRGKTIARIVPDSKLSAREAAASRLIAATALVHRVPLVSADEHLRAVPGLRRIW